MARQATLMKQTRTRHSQVYKDEALALAERIVSKAAEQLGLHASQLYGWRSKRQQTQTSSEREQSLADENARLKRLLAEQAEELAIVKKPPRTLPKASSEVRLHENTRLAVPGENHVPRAGCRP
tara:strand:- start:1319 stop:1690 length:372 start_codon:yes stop_codon:yes gene_type:complete